MAKTHVSTTINGEPTEFLCEPSQAVLDVLRDQLGLTGTKEGCGNGNCGSCTVLMDGAPVNACLVLAREAEGCAITTIEGVGRHDRLHPIQEALVTHGGTQCGFCTPGIVLSAVALLQRTPKPDEHAIRHAIAGNICRCTGYDKIVEAIASIVAEKDAP